MSTTENTCTCMLFGLERMESERKVDTMRQIMKSIHVDRMEKNLQARLLVIAGKMGGNHGETGCAL